MKTERGASQTQAMRRGSLTFFLDKRCWLKTLSWRILATTTTILLLNLFGFRLELAASAGIAINLFKTILFYLHERLWEARRA